jgi:hypothetical protein
MRRGPIAPLDPTQYDLAVDLPEFADAVAADLAGLDPEDQVHADVSSTLTALAATPIDQVLGPGLADVSAELDYHSSLPGPEDLDQAQADAATGDQAIIDAYGEIPGEAWELVPLPFSSPPGGGTQVPTTPPATPTIIVPPGVAPPGVISWPPQPWVGLTNLTHRDQPFVVGDRWQIDVQGNVNAAVTMSGTHEADSWEPYPLGFTDARGHLIVQGQMTAAEVGHWTQTWYLSGNKCWPGTITFDVAAQ